MKRLLLLLLMTGVLGQVQSQFVHKIKADSVLITNDSCTAELNLENSTKHIKGFLYNKGNGRTEFRKVVKLNDSTFIMGSDTLVIGGNTKNLATAPLVANGDYLHDWKHFGLRIDSINWFQMRGIENDFAAPGFKTSYILKMFPHMSGSPLAFGVSSSNPAIPETSMHNLFWAIGYTTEMKAEAFTSSSTKRVSVRATANTATPTLMLSATNNTSTGRIIVYPDSIDIEGAKPSAAADSIYAPGPYDLFKQTNKLLKIPASSMANALTASNGVIKSGNEFKLGGQITEPTTITSSITSTNSITLNGASTGLTSLLNATNTSSGVAISGYTNGGIGVWGYNTTFNGIGVRADGGFWGLLAYTGTGIAVEGSASNGRAFNFIQNNLTSTNNITTIGTFKKAAAGVTPTDGYGLALDYHLFTVSNSDRQAGRFTYKWTTAADASRTSALEIFTVNNATLGRKAMLAGNGQWTWDGYSGVTAQKDTTANKPLSIDGSGNLVKMASWPGGGNDIATVSTTTAATVTPTPVGDIYAVTALAQNTTIAAPTGTFPDGKIIVIRIRDDGTSRTITWNSAYAAGSLFTLPASTTVGKTMYVTIIFNDATSKFDAVGYSNGH